jgi:hypothetical protein
MSKFVDKFKKHNAELPPSVPEFAYVVMTENDKTTHHIFLIDMVTENYKLIRTLKNMDRKSALEYTKDLVMKSSAELHNDTLNVGRYIDAELLKYDQKI